MKKLLLTTAIAMIGLGALAQGTVGFLNTAGTQIIDGRTGTPTAAVAGQFYYTLFTAAYTGSNSLPAAPLKEELSGATWTWTGIYATNIPAAGRLSGGANVATANGWAPGDTRSYVVVGWSASLGHDWAVIQNQIQSGAWADPAGAIGVSSVGFGIAGGGSQSLPFFGLFGSGATASGTPLTSGFTLIQVPEPTTFTLAGLGVAAALILRRRRQ